MSDLYRRLPLVEYDEDGFALVPEDGLFDSAIEAVAVPVETVDRVWFCIYARPAWSNADAFCNPDRPRTGDDCTNECGWYLMVKDDDDA